jgi:hypothetical protein
MDTIDNMLRRAASAYEWAERFRQDGNTAGAAEWEAKGDARLAEANAAIAQQRAARADYRPTEAEA